MLYLIKLDNAYKIGFSENVEFRTKELFKTHIDCELLSTKFGNKKDEKELHTLCNNYFIKNELFQATPEVEKIFNTYISIHLKEEINKKMEELIKINKDNKKLELLIERYLFLIGDKI